MVTQRAILSVLILALLPVGLTAGSPNGDKEKLQKELAKVERDLKREQARVDKKKSAIEKEYGLLMKKDVQQKLGEKIRKIGSTWAGGLQGANKGEAIRQIKKELRPVLKDNVGPNLAAVLIDDLTSNLVDRTEGPDKVGADEALKTTIEDLFPEGKFEEDFDSIKGKIFARFERLTQKREQLKNQLAEIERRENALKAGVPPAMLQVPAGKHGIGLDDKDIQKTIKMVGAKPEGAIHWWVGSPRHTVELPDFYIDVNEVTNAWYAEYVKDNPEARVPRYWNDGKCPDGWENRPVTDISHDDALAFARWMGRRLPTEFEWEAAARYTQDMKDLRVWPWGTAWDVMKIRCNNDLAIEHPVRRTIPPTLPPLLDVGSFPQGQSALGGNDFAGNAYEITSSPFRPYKGFKGKKINKARISTADFNREHIVIRGGDCNKRDVVVSTTWRLGISKSAFAPWVGFRTAASSVRGLDHVTALTEGGALKRYLVDYAPLPSDILKKRQYADLASDDPARFSSIMAGGFNPETNLPTKAKRITLINRRANDFRNHNAVRALAKDNPVMLGFLHIDVPVVEPKLEPGQYFIAWQNSYVPEVEEVPGEGDAKGKPTKPTKPKRGKKGKKDQEGPEPVPEAFIFIKVGGRKQDPIRVTKFLPPVVASLQPTRVVPNAANDTVDLMMAFPMKFQKKNAYVATLRLKLEPGTVKDFK